MSLYEIFYMLRQAVIAMQPFVVFLTGCFTFYLILRTRPRRLKVQKTDSGSVIINWTGHPLPESDWAKNLRVWTPDKAPYFNTQSWNSLRDSVHKLIRGLPDDLQFRLLKGDPKLIIPIPQLAAGLSVLLATIHGKSGTFPTITCPLRKEDDSFMLPEPVSLSEVRLEARDEREAV
ncbi:MAG: hypothetical protein D6785_02030 [Planctomycetota bacterium]|nr:MAG: hypothetical protein D6785_02030 [Planctomycetota bacterium]